MDNHRFKRIKLLINAYFYGLNRVLDYDKPKILYQK